MSYKILYLVLDHHTVKKRSLACQSTWMQDIASTSDIVFIGDPRMPNSINGFEVYKPIKDEPLTCRDNITEKMVLSFEFILKKEWDFLVRIDVDAYCNIKSLNSFLDLQNRDHLLYAGQGIHFLNKCGPLYLSNVGDSLPPSQYEYYYAQGGCYVLSRKSLEKSFPHMFFPAPALDWAEDLMVGVSMEKAGVTLNDRPDLFNSGYKGKGWPGMGTRRHTIKEHIDMINSGYISTHTLNSKQIHLIHNALCMQS